MHRYCDTFTLIASDYCHVARCLWKVTVYFWSFHIVRHRISDSGFWIHSFTGEARRYIQRRVTVLSSHYGVRCEPLSGRSWWGTCLSDMLRCFGGSCPGIISVSFVYDTMLPISKLLRLRKTNLTFLSSFFHLFHNYSPFYCLVRPFHDRFHTPYYLQRSGKWKLFVKVWY